jgi:hypothetical protein
MEAVAGATAIDTNVAAVTWKGTLLLSVPLGVVTWTAPVVAPVGTVVWISVSDTTVNVAAVPLKLTLVAPVRLFPRIMTAVPTPPEVGTVFTKGPRPTARLKTVPTLVVVVAVPITCVPDRIVA